MPTEKTASSSVTTFSSPRSTSRAKGVIEVRKIEPKNHNHEMPSTEWNTDLSRAATLRLRHVSENGFQLIASAGSGAGECGMKCAATRPATATARHAAAT